MSTRKGELRVNVISAKGLRDTAIFGIQDPYVQVLLCLARNKKAVASPDEALLDSDSLLTELLRAAACLWQPKS